jgi:DnaJ family protein A protein 5
MDNQSFDEQEEDEEISEFYCVVCDKAYKSEKQFTSHESSKRHIENVEILRQEMLADEENFELGDTTPLDIDAGIPVENDYDDLSANLEQLDLTEQEELEILVSNTNKKKKKRNKNKMTPHWGFDEETMPDDMDEMSVLAAALEEEKSRRKRKGNNRTMSPSPANNETITEQDDQPTIEKESAKTKREKRKEKKKLKEESELTEVSN